LRGEARDQAGKAIPNDCVFTYEDLRAKLDLGQTYNDLYKGMEYSGVFFNSDKIYVVESYNPETREYTVKNKLNSEELSTTCTRMQLKDTFRAGNNLLRPVPIKDIKPF
jgi:hypothetical protein